MSIDGKSAHARYEAMLDAMVDKFLARKLPQDFSPDAGIVFERTFSSLGGEVKQREYSGPFWPSGTNLFCAEQVKQMFRECVPPACFGLDDCSSTALSSCSFADKCGG